MQRVSLIPVLSPCPTPQDWLARQAAAKAAEEAASARAEQLVGKLRAAVRKGKALEAQRDEFGAQVSSPHRGL